MISLTAIDGIDKADADVVWHDGERVFYRARQIQADGSGKPILAVAPVASQRSDTQQRLAQEYSFRGNLDSEWALTPVEYDSQRGILGLECDGAVPCASLIGPPMGVEEFLVLALAVSESLTRMHAGGFIHKDIKPANLFTNSQRNKVWITGFGVATRVPRERQSPLPPEVIVGTFAYMAPEQTGRMNRSIDARSDLYSVGVALYEILTGTLPFNATDPMEWIHCHIARQPSSPSERVSAVPDSVSAIMLKLLAKAAEDRYQTAAGLRHDLQRCLEAWKEHRSIEAFNLGEKDTANDLVFREKLYGRKDEVDALVSAFDRVVADGAFELVLVSGYSGIGKSSVVNELQRALVPPRGLFAGGKFDQYKRGIPYATVAQAFQGLVGQLLSKSDAELSRWRAALTDALGANGQLMVNLVPELELIIGAQPLVPELSGPEAQTRLFGVFVNLLQVFARKEHPLVLFLDDLQWLDLATLDLFAHIASQANLKHVLLVGAYRDNEVGPAHPLARRLDIVRNLGRPMHELVLGGIPEDSVTQMLADATNTPPSDLARFSRTVSRKTGGNPFFAIQFVGALADEGLLLYDSTTSRWIPDIDRIESRQVSENVVDLMIERLKRLSASALEAVKTAACMGNSVAIDRLSYMLERTDLETQDLMREALRGGLILQVDATYTFAHDRVQEAAYALLSGSERSNMHLRLGRRFLAMGERQVEDEIFEVVDHFNRGGIPAADTALRSIAASLNLQAGLRAKMSSAYPAARTYLAKGVEQLGDNGWTSDYRTAFALAHLHAECTFLAGDLNRAMEMIDPLLTRAQTTIDSATVYRLKVYLHVVRSENVAAVQSGLAALRLFGITFPEHPEQDEIEREFDRIWENLDGRPFASVADLPRMTNAEMLVAMRVLAEIWPPTFFTDFNLTTLAVCRMVNISLQYGVTDASNQGFALLGWIMGPALGRYEEGYPIVKLACDLAEKGSAPLDMARVYNTMGLTASWTQPLAKSIEWYRIAYRIGLEAGDAYFACFSSAFIAMTHLQQGHNLRDEAEETIEYLNASLSTGFRDGADMIVVAERASACLRGLTRSLSDFSDEHFDQAEFEADLLLPRAPVPGWFYWTRKVMLHYLAGEYEDAIRALDKVQTGRCKIVQIQHLDYYFYGALALASYHDKAPYEAREGLRRRLDALHGQIARWAVQTSSPTFAGKLALTSAEIARLDSDELAAERGYEESIRLSVKNGFLQDEAIANEAASQFYAGRGFEKIARVYLQDAWSCFQKWGADAKVRQIEEKLVPTLDQFAVQAQTIDTALASVDQLDLATVMRVSQAVSSEIVLGRLIDTLMRAAIEHAGAERALLIFAGPSELEVVAEAMTIGDNVTVSQNRYGMQDASLAQSVLHYVARTRESAVLDEAAADKRFSDDPFIRERQAKSLLCLPMTNQGKLIGLLYLENNLAPRVFTSNRLAILKLLASQAAISLENTRLYRDLEEREARIRRLVDANIIGVFTWRYGGEIVDANDSFLQLVGFDRGDLAAGRLRWTELSPPDGWDNDAAVVAGIRATGIARPWEKEFFRKDGSRVPVLIGAAAYGETDSEGGVAYVLDLSGPKAAEAAARESDRRFRELQAELAHANRIATVGQLAAAIAHDVRQPLVGVISSAGAGLNWLATTPPNDEAVRRSLERVISEGHRAAGVLESTRALFKGTPLVPEAIDLNATILNALPLVQGEATRRSIVVSTNLDKSLPEVPGDRIQLQQVVLNLVMNAIEAMDGVNEKERVLTLTTGREPDQVYVSVSDTGPGVVGEGQSRLFEAFYTTKSNGMGMGLAICKAIANAHGGKLWVTSNEPRGAVFWLGLPFSPVSPDRAPIS